MHLRDPLLLGVKNLDELLLNEHRFKVASSRDDTPHDGDEQIFKSDNIIVSQLFRQNEYPLISTLLQIL